MAPSERRPPEKKVRQAVEQARDRSDGKVLKVLFLDEQGESVGEWASSQLPENAFQDQMTQGLQEPPYRLEQLVYLAELHPVHSAALEQKTADVCGSGWKWVPRDPDEADESFRDDLDDWFQSLAPDDSDMRELIWSAELDLETLGWGLAEIVRSPDGIVQRMYQVPGHTVRANRDGWRLAQIRDRRKVWFKRWGAPLKNGKPVMVDASLGTVTTVKEPADPANDLFVVRRPSRRSDFYGIPGYISSMGWITLALAARDDNLYFFSNRREPRWAIVLSNLADDPNLEEDLRRSFQVDLRQPYRNLLIPISGAGKIDFQKLTDNRLEGSFDRLSERADKAIMISHRVPAERLANAEIGPLGGDATAEASRIYKEAVVATIQELWNSRINAFLEVEYPKVLGTDTGKREQLPWRFELEDLDLGTDREELEQTVMAFHGNLISLREARQNIGREPLMVPKTAPEPPPLPPEPVLDPATGEPKLHPVTGAPIMAEPQPAELPGDPLQPDLKPGQREPGEEVELVESELNDKLFTELPGAAGKGGTTTPEPRAGLLKEKDRATELLTKDVRELWGRVRDQSDMIADLASTDRE